MPTLCTLPNGLTVEALNRRNTLSLYDEIFVDGVYDFPGLELRDGDTVIDVGANIGLFAMWCLDRAKVRLTCFEPNPVAYAALRENTMRFPYRAVQCRQWAVSDRLGYAEFTVYPHLPELCTLHPQEDTERERATWLAYLRRRFGIFGRLVRWWLFRRYTMRVRTVRLAEEVSGPIDLLKIDCEKSEHAVLDGAGDLSRVKQIIVENHLGPPGRERLDKRLRDAGFSVQWHPSNVFKELDCPLAFGRRA